MPFASTQNRTPMRRRFSDPSPLSRRCSSLAAASLVVAALLSPPFVAAVRATSPRRRTSPRLCRSASRRRQLLASTLLLPPLVDAAPHRVAPLVASTPLLPPLLSRRTPLPYTASPRCHTSSTSFLSSPQHLSSPRCHASSPPLPLLIRPRLRPRHSYRCICTRAFRRFAAVLCVFGDGRTM